MNQRWIDYFIGHCDHAATMSKDPSTKVGCVIVGPNKEIRSTGFNGLPRGVEDERLESLERPDKYLWIEHAERNAIYNAARCGTSLEGCIMFCQKYPCADCARAIIQSGIRTLYCHPPESLGEDWERSCFVSRTMMEEAGVEIIIVQRKEVIEKIVETPVLSSYSWRAACSLGGWMSR